MSSVRLALVLVVLAKYLGGCLGEAAVTVQGTVTEGPVSSYSFDDAPNPNGNIPIAGALVQVCANGCSEELGHGHDDTTDDAGVYTEIAISFGGFAGGETEILVKALAPDGRETEYRSIFEDTSDPLIANPSCDPPCPPVYLNLVIGP